MKKLLFNLFIILGICAAMAVAADAETITGQVVVVGEETITIEAEDQIHELGISRDLLEAIEPGDKVTAEVDGQTVVTIVPADEVEEATE